MTNEELFEMYKELEARVSQLEFREGLLREDTNVNGLLLDYNLKQEQYVKIMDVMDEMRKSIGNNIKVTSAAYERKIIDIFGGDRKALNRSVPIEYHFCEYIAKAFMNDGRWEEVFPVLYGDSIKYKYLKNNNNE